MFSEQIAFMQGHRYATVACKCVMYDEPTMAYMRTGHWESMEDEGKAYWVQKGAEPHESETFSWIRNAHKPDVLVELLRRRED